ncbi:alpha/beta hydrolase [Marinomonas primoryensis]|jgi:pimeloyl-ACP methyl ester carboxylesterase|uniref:alpha/beta hydrolase n=1 Tax=Marinomonas primoryensis TaxID=178399 RepID=UPI0037042749
MNYALEVYKLRNKIGSVIAPNWVAKAVSIKFLSPKRYAIKAWERRAEQAGTRFNLSEQVSVIRWSKGSRTDHIKSENKQILLIHGWESRATQMYGLVEGLLRQDYTVFAVDMPGHGHSSGEVSDAYLFYQTIKLAQQELGHFHAIIGHSMGAGAAAIAVGKGVTTNKLILISGPSSIENVLRRFSGFVGLNKKTTNKFIDFIGHHVGVLATELDATKLLGLCDIPTLLIHDEHDIEVPISESKILAKTFTQSELFVTKGLGHRKILKSDEVHAKISGFVNIKTD